MIHGPKTLEQDMDAVMDRLTESDDDWVYRMKLTPEQEDAVKGMGGHIVDGYIYFNRRFASRAMSDVYMPFYQGAPLEVIKTFTSRDGVTFIRGYTAPGKVFQ